MTRRRSALTAVVLTALVFVPAVVVAHVGSPDVFVDAEAGPYHVFVTVRPPWAIPGSAGVEILTSTPGVRTVHIVPTPLTGAAAAFAPAPAAAVRSKDNAQLFSGDLWMMTAGAWQVRITVEGDQGVGIVSVPVPTLPQATAAMGPGLGALLLGLTFLLAAGLVSIVSAMAREASLEVGEAPTSRARRRGRIAAGIATGVVTVILILGNSWWTAEASSYARYVYKPLQAVATPTGTGQLSIALRDPGWIALRRLDDLVPDHGHVMHLFVVSPALDRFWHLHPRETGGAVFEERLPAMPAGSYEFFADVVHATGISETATGDIDMPDVTGAPLEGDDSAWTASAAPPASTATRVDLPDGSRMVWVRDARPLRTKQLTLFTFRVEDAAGRPATDLELYMGMPGHAVFIRRDHQVFAHVHPSGSAPMAAMEISQRSLVNAGLAPPPAAMDMSPPMTLPATITFPFGIPSPGDYRIFVQVKKSGQIETGAFDAHVE